MEVLKTFVFSNEEYKDTILKKVICNYDFEKQEYTRDSVPYSENEWPLFHKIIVYVGENRIRIERPYSKTGNKMGSTIYPSTLIDVPEIAMDEVKDFLNLK
jgi:hypothetical protein